MKKEETKIDQDDQLLKSPKNKIEQKRVSDQETARLILFKTESQIDKPTQRENEIIELLGGKRTTIALINELNKLLLKDAKPYQVTFISEYYDELRRITGFKKSLKNPHYKPSIFAVYTIRFIYRRFGIKELITTLQLKNPFITGYSIRPYKHFQFLNEEAQKRLEGYILEAIAEMKKSNTIDEFQIKYGKKFGLTVENDMFCNGD